jgi:hypothetical protein
MFLHRANLLENGLAACRFLSSGVFSKFVSGVLISVPATATTKREEDSEGTRKMHSLLIISEIPRG